MTKKSTYIVLLVIMFLLLLVLFLFYGIDSFKKGKYETTLIVGDNTTWVYKNKKWTTITLDSGIYELEWKKYNVFQDNKAIGNYYLWHDDKWYAFDENKKAIIVEGDFLAYSSNVDVKVLDFQSREITNESYIYKVLNENGFSESSKFTSKYYTTVDIDSDGVEEDFYLISNAFPLDFSPEKIFSIVFMVKDGKIYYIYRDIDSYRSFNGCKPYFRTFIDTDADDIYEFVLSCGGYSTSKPIDMLYRFVDGEFKIIISNQ